MEAGRSPGGNDEKIGGASAFSDRLTIGMVEVILTNPVKFNPSSGPRIVAPCAKGPSVMTLLPSWAPAVLYTATVMLADRDVDGFA